MGYPSEGPVHNEKNAVETDDLDPLRQRLVAIDAEIRSLPCDDFEGCSTLRAEAGALRRLLRAGAAEETDAARKRWSERAGHKGAHEVDYETQQEVLKTQDAGWGGGPAG